MSPVLLPLIRWYQHTAVFRHHASCRFQPTCSQYMYDAISKYGTIRGVLLGLRRMCRCHPWSQGGYDPLI